LTVKSAVAFVVLFGLVSLFGDMSYEGGRSLVGQYLRLLGSSAAAVAVAAGAGELLGYVLRLLSGIVADKTRRYWGVVFAGYLLQLFALPALALVVRWELAVALVFAERIGKGIRKPSVDSLLAYGASRTGRGFGFGLHEAMDQIGAFLGPVILSVVLYLKGRAAASAGEIEGYRVGFLILLAPAVLAVVALTVARFLFPRPADFEVKAKTPEIATRGFTRAYWIYVAAASLLAAGMNDFAFLAFHFERVRLVPAYLIPTVYAVAMAVDGAAALVLGTLYDRKGMNAILVLFVVEAFTAPLVFLGGVRLVVAGMALWGISMGAQESVMRAAVADLVPSDRRATAYGLFHTAFGVAWFVGSAAMGFLYDWSIRAVVVFSVVVQLAAIPVFLAATRANRSGQPRS